MMLRPLHREHGGAAVHLAYLAVCRRVLFCPGEIDGQVHPRGLRGHLLGYPLLRADWRPLLRAEQGRIVDPVNHAEQRVSLIKQPGVDTKGGVRMLHDMAHLVGNSAGQRPHNGVDFLIGQRSPRGHCHGQLVGTLISPLSGYASLHGAPHVAGKPTGPARGHPPTPTC